jgi:hypothetical protein
MKTLSLLGLASPPIIVFLNVLLDLNVVERLSLPICILWLDIVNLDG